MTLVERESYLEQLAAHRRAAAAGHGRVVFVAGEAGVGKSSLVNEFCRRTRDEAEILRMSCDALSTPGPLAPLRDVAPALGLRIDREAADGEGREWLFRSALGALAARPGTILMVGEDAHWTDGASLELLRFLARRIGELRVLWVVTYRDDELGPGHPLRQVLGDLATEATVHRIWLPPLSEDGVRAMAMGADAMRPVFIARPEAIRSSSLPAVFGCPRRWRTPSWLAPPGSRPMRARRSMSRR
jgi:predicted ATPase